MTPTLSAPRLAALVVILAAAPASARIAVLPLSGPRNHTLERQLSSAICGRLGCVPASTVMSGSKVDWDKVRRARLDGVVVGGLSKATRPQVLEVSFLTPDAQRAWRERYTVVNGRVPSDALVQIRDAVAAAATKSSAPPATKAAPPPAAAAATPPAAAAIAPPPPGEIAPPPPGALAPPAAGDVTAASAIDAGGRPKPDLVEIEVAVQLLHRTWDYSGYDASGGLRTYTVSLLTEPRARIGVYPLRGADGLFASAGLELAGAVGVGATVGGDDPAAGRFPLSLWWLDAGMRVRLRLGSWVLGPGAGFLLSHQSVGASSGGTTLGGIPTVNAKAVRLGLEASGPLAGAFGLTAEVNYLLVLSTGLDTAAFPDQSGGPAFEARLGLSFQISPLLRLLLAGTLSRETYTLNVPGSADSAQASVFGGELGIRVGF